MLFLAVAVVEGKNDSLCTVNRQADILGDGCFKKTNRTFAARGC